MGTFIREIIRQAKVQDAKVALKYTRGESKVGDDLRGSQIGKALKVLGERKREKGGSKL